MYRCHFLAKAAPSRWTLALWLAIGQLTTFHLDAAVPAEDWPMFRGGPALLGIAGGSLSRELKLLWSFKTGGPVKSSAAGFPVCWARVPGATSRATVAAKARARIDMVIGIQEPFFLVLVGTVS